MNDMCLLFDSRLNNRKNVFAFNVLLFFNKGIQVLFFFFILLLQKRKKKLKPPLFVFPLVDAHMYAVHAIKH